VCVTTCAFVVCLSPSRWPARVCVVSLRVAPRCASRACVSLSVRSLGRARPRAVGRSWRCLVVWRVRPAVRSFVVRCVRLCGASRGRRRVARCSEKKKDQKKKEKKPNGSHSVCPSGETLVWVDRLPQIPLHRARGGLYTFFWGEHFFFARGPVKISGRENFQTRVFFFFLKNPGCFFPPPVPLGPTTIWVVLPKKLWICKLF